MNGFLIINKPEGISSGFALNKVKRKLNKAKCGHMGTLDPLASGVLPVAVGKSTRLFDYLLEKTKIYSATFTFGYETDTLDREGTVIKEGGRIPEIDEVIMASRKQIGIICQVPPIYSAKKVNGVRSYDLARNGQKVELKGKNIEIISIDVTPSEKADSFEFYIVCKGGTYIRSICRDIAYSLGTYATMTRLERLRSGEFDIKDSVTIDELDNIDIETILIKPEKVIPFERLDLNEKEYTDLICGRECLIDKNEGKYKVMYNDELVCIGEIKNKNLVMLAYLKD